MGYGSNVTSDGKKIGADSDFIPAAVNIQENVVLTKITLDTASEKHKCTFEFRQENGAIVKHSEFDGQEDWMIDGVNRRTKHIATKFMSEADYHAAVAGATGFDDFMNKLIAALTPRLSETAKFRMIFRYDRNYKYVVLPQYPNFIESMDIPKEASKLVVSDYDKKYLTKVKPDVETTTETAENDNDLEF